MAEAAVKTDVATLEIRDLHATVEGKEILKGIDLTVRQGEIRFKGEDVLSLTPDQRAQRGLFLAFQYPTEVPGVSVVNFLRTAYKAVKGEDISALAFRKHMKEKMNLLDVEDSMVQRYVNQGFSGGEKKKNEVLQLAVLEPEIAILDETDSGLDIDSLKAVATGISELAGPDLGVLVITHYQRILNYITPDRVHVMMSGRIVKTGGPELAHELEQKGYEGIRAEVGLAEETDGSN